VSDVKASGAGMEEADSLTGSLEPENWKRLEALTWYDGRRQDLEELRLSLMM